MTYSIYKLTDNTNNTSYIGSTQNITGRLRTHLSQYKKFCNSNDLSIYCSSFEIFKNNNYSISILETTEDKKEAISKECHYIKITPNIVNKNRPIITPEEKEEYKKQYRETNKDKINLYRETNKDKINKYLKEYYSGHKDKYKEYYEANKEAKKTYYQINKEKLKAYQKQRYNDKKINNNIQ
jgi:predicted GIY-YIG superfamily endonuclease